MKVVGVVCLVCVLCLAAAVGGVMWTWDSWGSKKWAEIRGEAEEVEEKPEAVIKELAPRPVVATSVVSANEQVYEQWVSRDDVLVMVEYYSDT